MLAWGSRRAPPMGLFAGSISAHCESSACIDSIVRVRQPNRFPDPGSNRSTLMISRDDCRRRAFEYFLAAAEADDEGERQALLNGGEKWVRLALRIEERYVSSEMPKANDEKNALATLGAI